MRRSLVTNALLAVLTRLIFPRRLPGGRGEECVSLPAPASTRNDDLLTIRQHLRDVIRQLAAGRRNTLRYCALR